MAPTDMQLHFMLWAVVAISVCPVSTSEMSLLDIRPYFPNNTLIYSQFACSEREQECFRENKLLYEADGECHSVGGQGPCAQGEIFHADKAEAQRKGGHLRGTCHKPCPGVDHAPLAATGECMARSDVESKICRTDLYLRAAMDVFGQWVCEWTMLVCKSRPSYVGGGFPEQYTFYTGICSPPALFGTLIDGGGNVTVPDENPTDHPLLEYFLNETIFERDFQCTEEEKACLQYGRLLNTNGSCYRPNQWTSNCEPGETFHLDLDEAMKEDGRLVGTCSSPCKDFSHPQIKTGECVDFTQFSNQICRWEWGMQTEVDAFGRMSCRCAWSHDTSPPPPALPSPAANPDHCRAPDFSNPVNSPNYDSTLTLGFSLPCSEEEFACLKEGKVLLSGSCHTLRTRGPCAQGEEVVLDKEALAHARLQPKCTPSPCPDGSVHMPIDGKCLTHQQVISLLCPEQHVALDEFGGWQCDYQPDNWPANLSSIIRHEDEGLCELLEKYGQPVPMPVGVQNSNSNFDANNNEYHINEV